MKTDKRSFAQSFCTRPPAYSETSSPCFRTGNGRFSSCSRQKDSSCTEPHTGTWKASRAARVLYPHPTRTSRVPAFTAVLPSWAESPTMHAFSGFLPHSWTMDSRNPVPACRENARKNPLQSGKAHPERRDAPEARSPRAACWTERRGMAFFRQLQEHLTNARIRNRSVFPGMSGSPHKTRMQGFKGGFRNGPLKYPRKAARHSSRGPAQPFPNRFYGMFRVSQGLQSQVQSEGNAGMESTSVPSRSKTKPVSWPQWQNPRSDVCANSMMRCRQDFPRKEIATVPRWPHAPSVFVDEKLLIAHAHGPQVFL